TGTGAPNPRFLTQTGFNVEGVDITVDGNTAVDNRGAGWTFGNEVTATSVRSFAHNSTVGNGGPGRIIRNLPTIHGLQFHNSVCNDGTAPEVTCEPLQNCGVVNATGATVQAVNNFWGSARGHGTDPADNAGPGCDATGSKTVLKPFAALYQ